MDDSQVKARLIELIGEMPPDQQRDLLKLLEWGHSDQRKHRRKTCSRPVSVSAGGDWFEGTVKNVSEGGMFIEIPTNVSVGQEVSLVFSLFSFEDPVTITGKVVRVEPLGVAVKFDALFHNFFNNIPKRGTDKKGMK